jgi:peptidoglycan hydrolase-like protein with peptidoglycan-binding domain
MGLYNKLIEQSWMDTPAPGIKKKPVAVPDTPAATTKASAMDMSKLAPAKTGAMDTAKLAKSADAGLGVGEKLSAKQVGKSLAAKYAAPAAAAINAYDAYSRYKEGDYTGAAISGLAGAAAFVPVVGAPVSLGLDALNLYRTYTGKDQQHPAATEPTTAPPTAPTATKPEATPAAPTAPTATKPEATPAAPTTTEKPSKGTAAKPSKGASVTAKHAPRPQHSAAPFDIKSFQTHLNSLGAGIAVDGKPGPATDAAVRTYLLHQR